MRFSRNTWLSEMQSPKALGLAKFDKEYAVALTKFDSGSSPLFPRALRRAAIGGQRFISRSTQKKTSEVSLAIQDPVDGDQKKRYEKQSNNPIINLIEESLGMFHILKRPFLAARLWPHFKNENARDRY